MSFDHGILNVPLSKRGNIDAQIDAYLTNEVRARELRVLEARREFQEDKKRAYALIAALPDTKVATLARASGCRRGSVRKLLRERADVHPRTVWSALEADAAKASP